MNGVLEWEDWLAGWHWRREIGNQVAPEAIWRAESSADRRLRALFDGERGLPFTPTQELPGKSADGQADA